MDYLRLQREHTPIHIDRATVEGVKNLHFLCVHITDDLKWSLHIDCVVKEAQQHLFNLRRINTFVLAPKTLTNFYRCIIERILSGCITAWYGNCTVRKHMALQVR